MTTTKKSAVVSGAGWIAGFTDKLISALQERGVTNEDIHRLATETGTEMVGKIADALVAHLGDGSFAITVGGKSLAVLLICLGSYSTNGRAEAILKKQHCRPLNGEEFSVFARKYPHLGHLFPIIALGSKRNRTGDLSDMLRYHVLDKRGLRWVDAAGKNVHTGEFGEECRFAAIYEI